MVQVIKKLISFHSRNGGTRHRRMKFEGVVANIDRRYHESPSEYTREVMSKYMTELPLRNLSR